MSGWVPRSIRARLSATAIVLAAGLLTVVSVLLLTLLRWQLTDNLDEGLAQRADAIGALLAGGADPPLADDEDLLIQLIEPDGRVIAASSNVSGLDPIAPLSPGFRTIRYVPGRDESFRLLARDATAPGGGPALLLVAVNDDDVADPMAIMTRLLLVIVPAVVGVLGVVSWWLTGRALRPVDQLGAQMAEFSETNLGGRVPEPATGDEIARLARTINQTLRRLEGAVRRQQRFVADASHELRSPLTRIRGELELDLADPEQADPVTTERNVLAETIGLQDLLDDLLHLARADAGQLAATDAAVDLDDIVLLEAAAIAARRRVAVDTRRVSGAQVTGNENELRRAVRNVLTNAERHAVTAVIVTLAEHDGTARLTIGDDGAGIPVADRDRIFERFARLDDARTRDAGGSGLGLAITQEIVERHGGTIRVADTGTTTFEITLPARA